MDMLSQPTPSQPQSKSEVQHWPNARAVRGNAYAVPDPVFGPQFGDMLAVMSYETWVDHGTAVERLRRDNEAAGKEIARLTVLNNTLTTELAQLREKHENLRAAEKRRRRASMGFIGSNS